MTSPMLAAKVTAAEVRFPVYASAKLDGVRGRIVGGKLQTRSGKPIPNAFTMDRFSDAALEGFDGELIVGAPNAKDVFRATSAATANKKFRPDVKFYVFDNGADVRPFVERYEALATDHPHVVILQQRLIKTEAELVAFEEEMLALGFEGLILRSPRGAYKNGRSTVSEGGMLKMKRFVDSEAVVVAVEEGEGACAGRMGQLLVRDVTTGVEFRVGSGFDFADRDYFWRNAGAVAGRMIKYKYFPVGVKTAPRHPVYLGTREAWDLS